MTSHFSHIECLGFDQFRADVSIYSNAFQYSAIFAEKLKWTGTLAQNEPIFTTSFVSFLYYSVSLNTTCLSGPFKIALMTYIQFYQNLNKWDKSSVKVICGKYRNRGMAIHCKIVKSSEHTHTDTHTPKERKKLAAHNPSIWFFCDTNLENFLVFESLNLLIYLNLLTWEKSW